MVDLLTVLLIALATARITRLVTTDKIVEGPRLRLQFAFEARWERKNAPNLEEWGSKLAYLLGCDWCASIWIAPLVTIATMQVTSVPLPVLTALTASMLTGLLASSS